MYGQASRLLVEMTRSTWQCLGVDRITHEAFFHLVLARLVESASKLDSLRVLKELGT